MRSWWLFSGVPLQRLTAVLSSPISPPAPPLPSFGRSAVLGPDHCVVVVVGHDPAVVVVVFPRCKGPGFPGRSFGPVTMSPFDGMLPEAFGLVGDVRWGHAGVGAGFDHFLGVFKTSVFDRASLDLIGANACSVLRSDGVLLLFSW